MAAMAFVELVPGESMQTLYRSFDIPGKSQYTVVSDNINFVQ